jgi:putative transposase
VEIRRAYKVELDPNNEQRTALRCAAGCARWAYNWGLERKIEAYRTTGKSLSAIDLHKELNVLKKLPIEEGGVPWMYSVSKWAPQEALRNLDSAFKSFFKRCKKKAKKKGFPKFKSRHKNPLKFKLTGHIRTSEDGRRIYLPSLKSIRLKESDYLPGPEWEDVKIQAATLSERAGRWFVSLSCIVTILDPILQPRTKVVGVDVGIKSLAVTSDGRVFKNPRALAKMQRRLRQAQKALARKQKGSQNRIKARKRVAQLYYRVACIRQDALHKATTAIVRSADVICIESLNVAGMLKNHKIARALADASLSEFLRQVTYKASWAGTLIVEAQRFYPSSKTCSACGHIKQDLTLANRTYVCSGCGLVIDRDLNAAINLKNLAPSSGVTACGEAVRPTDGVEHLMAVSSKQELNSNGMATC